MLRHGLIKLRRMKKWGILGVALALVAGVTLAAFRPVMASTKSKNVTGMVVAVSSSSITVKGTPNVVYVINTKTKIFAKNGGKESIGVVSLNDTVTVVGTQTTTVVNTVSTTVNTAVTITDKSIWRAKVQGVVSDLVIGGIVCAESSVADPCTGAPSTIGPKTFNLIISKSVSELAVNATYSQSNIGNSLTKILQTTVTKTAATHKTVSITATKTWDDVANGQTVWTNGLWNSVKHTLIDSSITLPTITIKK